MEPTLLAYVTRIDEGAAISFGRNYMEARRKGALELGLHYDEVESCERAGQYDSYAPGPVPVQDLIEQFGWVYECWGCGCKVDEYLEVDDDETGELREDMAPVYGLNFVYCSPACQAREQAEKQRLQALATELKTGVLAKFPGVIPGMACVHNKPPCVYFTFPGGKGEGCWELGAETVLICKLDVETWRAFRREVASPTSPL